MKIAFYADSCIPIYDRSLEERPLGGTETGLIHVVRILAARGHQVSVFNQMSHPIGSGNLRYYHSAELFKHAPFDAFIAVKDWRGAFFGVQASRFYLWTGDGPEQYSTYGIGDGRVEERFAAIFTASVWQGEQLALRGGVSPQRFVPVGNGVDPSLFVGSEPRGRHRLIYTSAPYRGLLHLGRYFPKIREVIPDAELHVFGAMSLYDGTSPFQGPQVELQQKIFRALGKIPGITVHGAVPQRQLAREYLRSAVYVYPNTVPETFCITAIEAQAGGCPVVSTAMAGLNESVGEGGILVAGNPGDPEYDQRFIEGCLILLRDDTVWNRFSGVGQGRILSRFTWEGVASRMEQVLRVHG